MTFDTIVIQFLKLPNLGGLSFMRVSYAPGSRKNSYMVMFLTLLVFRLLNRKLP